MVQENESYAPSGPPLPRWIAALSPEDLAFIKRFVLASGSLKAVAEEYGVSYPTIRARVDRLIQKVRIADDDAGQDAFERELRLLVADGHVNAATARALLNAHRTALNALHEGGDPS